MQNLMNRNQRNSHPLWKHPAVRTSAIVAAMIVAASSVTQPALAASPEAMITVIDGNRLHEVSTRSEDAQGILDMAGIVTSEQDRIVTDTDGVHKTITVKRAVEVPVTADGQTKKVACYTGDSVQQVLTQAGITLGETDRVNFDINSPVLADTALTVTRYYQVYLVDRGVAKTYTIPEGTVAESMAAAGVALEGEDVFSNAEEMVSENLVIGVDHVTYEEIQVTEEIPYSVVKEASATLYKGCTEVKARGVNGSKIVTKRQKLVNGEVVSAEVLHEEITKQPVNEVVLTGTKAKPSSVATGISITPGGLVDASGKSIAYSKKIVGSCTAYTGGGTTSTGKPAAVGRVAVNPNVIPYGSKLYICSPDGKYVYGYAIAADTGGALMSGRVLCDLYMDSYGECVNFGRRQMAVYVLS